MHILLSVHCRTSVIRIWENALNGYECLSATLVMMAFHRLACSVAGIRKGRASNLGARPPERDKGGGCPSRFPRTPNPLFAFPLSSRLPRRLFIHKNDRDQVLCGRESEHPTQTLVFTKTAGRHNLVEVVVI